VEASSVIPAIQDIQIPSPAFAVMESEPSARLHRPYLVSITPHACALCLGHHAIDLCEVGAHVR
jgi:hypothetical protein